MSQENKDIVRRFWEAFARKEFDAATDLVTDDVVMHNSEYDGRDGFRAELEFWRAAFPDLSITLEDLVAEGDRVATRVTATGTHGGDFMGYPATGRAMTAGEIDIFRVENGKIAEVWSGPDLFAIALQIGMIPAEE